MYKDRESALYTYPIPMKKVATLIGGLFFLLTSPVLAQNLAVNGGFTSGTTGWTTLCTTELNPETTYGGSSLTNFVTEIDVERCINQQVCILPATTYRFSYKGSRRTQPSTPASVGITVKITGVQTGTVYLNVNHLYTNTVYGYTTYTYDVTVPAGSADKRLDISFVSFNNTATYGVLIDDMSLILGPATAQQLSIGGPSTAALNSPVNFSFVNGPTSGAVYTWNFGLNATPASSSAKDPTGIKWSTIGSKIVMARVNNGTCNVLTLTKVVTVDAVLPMKMHSFSGTVNGRANRLVWKAENLNRQQGKFVIERTSTNGFDSLGMVLIDPSSGTRTYDFTDLHPLQGSNQYRLRMTGDKSGLSYSKVIALTNDNDAPAMKLFPNPATSFLDVVFVSKNASSAVVQVFTLTGVIQSSQRWNIMSGNNKLRIEVSSLQAGSYVVKVVTAAGSGQAATFTKH